MARQDTHLTQTGAEVQALLDKVEGIEAGAQVNTVERLVINGDVLTPDSDKSIVILLKTLASQVLNGSGDIVQGPFTIVPTSLLCAAKSLNFTAIIFNVSREMVGLWVCKSGNDNSDKFYRVLSTSNAKCYKSSDYHVFDAANPGNYYALVISASGSVTFTTENVSSGDRTEQTAITIADRGYVDTAVTAKYTKPASGIPASDLADGVIPDISGKADAATTLAGYGITDAYTKTEIDSKVASTYKPAGSVANVGSLGSLTAANLGKVYNFTSSFTTTSDFVEGSGKTYPVGTNVVIVDVGTAQNPSYKYDVLAGFVDLSGYAHTADVNTALAGKQNYSTGTSFPANPQEGDVFVLTSDAWTDVDDNDVPYTQEMGGDMFYLGGCVDEMHGNFDGEGTITGYDMDGTIFFEDDYDGRYTKLDIEGCEYVCIKPSYSGDGLSFSYVPGAYVYQRGMWMPIKTMETNYFYWNLLVDSAQRASTAYQKPSGGIPKTDLADAVQTSLGKADTALQSFTETDPTVPSWAKASSKPSYDYSEIDNTPTIPDAVEANPTVPSGTTPTSLTGLKIGSSYYGIEGAVSDVTVGGTSVVSNGVAAVPAIPDVTGKADKVSGATNGHLAGLDSNGNLTDSGKSASDFQPTIDSSNKLPYSLISGTPTIPDAVEANPTVPSGTTPTALTGLKIGNGYYGIEGAVSDVTVGGTSVVNNGVAVIPQIPTVASMAAADIATAVDTAWNAVMS